MFKALFRRFRNANWLSLFAEVIVVFLGVTAGFLLNNWSLDQNVTDLETKYIESFSQDVDKNIEELENFIALDSVWLKQTMPLLAMIKDGTLPEDSTSSALAKIIQVGGIESTTGTYEDIINSGNLNIISDFDLKAAIVQYHMNIEQTEFIDSYFYRYFDDYITPFVFDEVDILKEGKVDIETTRTMRFRNVFAGYLSMVQQRNTSYKTLLEESRAFKNLLVSSH